MTVAQPESFEEFALNVARDEICKCLRGCQPPLAWQCEHEPYIEIGDDLGHGSNEESMPRIPSGLGTKLKIFADRHRVTVAEDADM